jgi:hypothetical protein
MNNNEGYSDQRYQLHSPRATKLTTGKTWFMDVKCLSAIEQLVSKWALGIDK